MTGTERVELTGVGKTYDTASGQTIAVLASGLDRPYPAGHSELLNRIGDVGLLVSELLCLKGKTLGELVRDRMAAFPASGEINSQLVAPSEAIARVEALVPQP